MSLSLNVYCLKLTLHQIKCLDVKLQMTGWHRLLDWQVILWLVFRWFAVFLGPRVHQHFTCWAFTCQLFWLFCLFNCFYSGRWDYFDALEWFFSDLSWSPADINFQWCIFTHTLIHSCVSTHIFLLIHSYICTHSLIYLYSCILTFLLMHLYSYIHTFLLINSNISTHKIIHF